MDPRVHQVMQMLRKQALMPPPCNADAKSGESDKKGEKKMSFEKMALEVNLSESRLRALFKSQVGPSPGQYVIRQKLKEAASELRYTFKRVTEIAADSGFESRSYFARAFKKVYGMAPTQYRRLYQQLSEEKDGNDEP